MRDETRSKNSPKKRATPQENSQRGSSFPNSKASKNRNDAGAGVKAERERDAARCLHAVKRDQTVSFEPPDFYHRAPDSVGLQCKARDVNTVV